MSFALPPLEHISPSRFINALPNIPAPFFIQPAEVKSQDPVVDALLLRASANDDDRLYPDVPIYHDETDGCDAEEVVQDLWHARNKDRQLVNQTFSWDKLCSASSGNTSTSPFVSEQPNDIFDAIRHFLLPSYNDSSVELQYMLPNELFDLLQMNLTGNSSPLYTWDNAGEHFVPNTARESKKPVVIIEGLDKEASESIINKFLTIGTLIRRLDSLISHVQESINSPVMHAFSHAVSEVLKHVRFSLTCNPPSPPSQLASLWLRYSNAESLLSTLAMLCGRNEDQKPPYDPLPDSPAALLSNIYQHLQRHIDNRSPRSIIAMVAYILTIASRNYFMEIEQSLGIRDPSYPSWMNKDLGSKTVPELKDGLLQLGDEVVEEGSVMPSNVPDYDQYELPDFFPGELTEALPSAQKSLRILQTVDPSHPLCSTIATTKCEWAWSQAAIEKLCTDQKVGEKLEETEECYNGAFEPVTTPARVYTELDQFWSFDLEPGAHMNDYKPNFSTTDTSFGRFLSAFPEQLPQITPTLHTLTGVVLKPLSERSTLLSNSLLQLFLTHLHLETHFILLRSYLLLTFPSFRTRLMAALFSHSDEYRLVGTGTRARMRARLGIQDGRDMLEPTSAGRGIGLNHGLADRDAWPPTRADLNFFLRTVIVDSLEQRPASHGKQADVIWKDAEIRMGFALRDLPVSNGKERWLDPMSIEALDFLYMDYKPPHPLEVIITPDILSKYQRIFTFLLRLLRAQTVSQNTYSNSFKYDKPVFQSNTEAQQLLISLRFQIQTFITSFVAYIFDSAIGAVFDAHLLRISQLREVLESHTPTTNAYDIVDVFMLETSHSEMLDHVLKRCLLRRNQRSARDALTQLLELALQFGTVLMDARQSNLEEFNAVERIHELHELYQRHMYSLVRTPTCPNWFKRSQSLKIKAIQTLNTKDQNFGDNNGFLHRQQESARDTTVPSPFGELLVRMDPTGWWRKRSR